MDTITVRRYDNAPGSDDFGTWNRFVAASRNGTFLFDRGYMDYHSDRFIDCSWMAFKGGSLRALLPANITADGVLHSHQGLSYGGWILPVGHVDGAELLAIFSAAAEAWRNAGIRELDYKRVPAIYHRMAADDDLYVLYRLGAQMTGCGLSTSIDLRQPVTFSQMQRRHLRKASQLDHEIVETRDTAQFMRLLDRCLQERHGVRAVHTSQELQLLRDRFPDNIRIFQLMVAGSEEPQAGVCVYDTGIVAHAQYIATTPAARKQDMLTLLFHHLITRVFADRRYFDFGISTEENGAILNEGLLRQKVSYGGGGTVYTRFRLRI